MQVFDLFPQSRNIGLEILKKLLQIMLCLGTLGLGIPSCGSSGVRGLNAVPWVAQSPQPVVNFRQHNKLSYYR